jgi:Uma2 family endonuclease
MAYSVTPAAAPPAKLDSVATQTLISIEEYLRTAYEPDAEYVDGLIVERSMPETPHSAVQVRLVQLFTPLSRDRNLHLMTELRMRISPSCIRIPDFAVFEEKPAELVPSQPPMIVVEIVSREDRHTDIVQKFEQYRSWAVPHIWLADPWQRQLAIYSESGLTAVRSFELADLGLKISAADLFD